MDRLLPVCATRCLSVVPTVHDAFELRPCIRPLLCCLPSYHATGARRLGTLYNPNPHRNQVRRSMPIGASVIASANVPKSPFELGTSWDPPICRSTDASCVRLLLCQAQPTPTRRAASNVETQTASTNLCDLSLWLPSAKLPSAWLPSAWLSASAAHKRTQPYPPAQPAYPPAPTPAAAAAVRRTPAPVPSGY